MKYIAFLHKENRYGFFDDVAGAYDEYAPETVPDMLIDLIESNAKTEHLWIAGLDLIAYDIIKMLNMIGYKDITSEKLPISKWHIRTFDYTIATTGTAYRMRIKTKSKKTLSIYNTCNLIGKDITSVIHDFYPQKSGDLCRDYTLATVSAIHSIISKQGGKIKNMPYTISMVASKSWKRISGIEYSDPELIDCYKFVTNDSIDLDTFIRDAYRGGWVYQSSLAMGTVGEGIVLDVNSLYPYIMRNADLPWGEPTFFDGDIPDVAKDKRHYYYVKVKCKFDLKDNYLPYIGISDWLHGWGIPLTTSDYIDQAGQRHADFIDLDGKKKPVTATITVSRTDWEVMQEAYDIKDVEYIGGVYFRTSRFIFRDYVDAYYEEKTFSRSKGNRANERRAKMMLNAVLGTCAKIRDRESIVYVFDDQGNCTQKFIKTRSQSKSYIHIAAAVLSYARKYIYEYAVKYKDRFLYSDTDSLHLLGSEVPGDIRISKNLGDFKVEKEFKHARYYKRKVYALQDNDGHFHLTFAGLSKDYKDYLECLVDANNEMEAIKNFLSRDCEMEPVGDDRFRDVIDDKILVPTMEYKNFKETREIFTSADDKFTALALEYFPNGWTECEDFKAHRVTQFMRL